MIYLAKVKYKKENIEVAICNSAFGTFMYEFKKNGVNEKLDFEYSLEDSISINDKFYKVVEVKTYCWDFKVGNKIKKAVKKLFDLYGDFNLELFKVLFTSCEYRYKYWDKIVSNFIEDGLYIGKGTIYKGYSKKFRNVPMYGWTTNLEIANCFGDFVVKIDNAEYKIIGGKEDEVIYLPNKKDQVILEG